MSKLSLSKMRLQARGLILLGLLVFSTVGLSSAQELLENALTGVIQDLEQERGYLVISGKRYGFDRNVTTLTWQGNELDDIHLERGMVLRFTLRKDMLLEVQVLGPAAMLEKLREH